MATTSSHTQTSSQKKASNCCQEWLHQARQPQPTFAKICTSTALLKRTPLPMTVVWMGKGGQEFEQYIDCFTGHVSQQQHMGYLLNEKVAILWLKHGSPEVVICIGMA